MESALNMPVLKSKNLKKHGSMYKKSMSSKIEEPSKQKPKEMFQMKQDVSAQEKEIASTMKLALKAEEKRTRLSMSPGLLTA